MYALKLVTVTPDGHHVEESFILGAMYRLQYYPSDAHSDVAARIEYSQGMSTPAFDIKKSDEAYITTLTGDTVRIINRGSFRERDEIAKSRKAAE